MAARDTSKAREAAARAKAAARGGAAPPAAAPARQGWLVALGVAIVAAVAWGFARLSPAWRLAGLVPWTGGGAWKVRRGQWIDPAAGASLTAIGEQLLAGDVPICSSLPLTLDVSLEAGGQYKRHLSHRTGRDVDIRAPSGMPTAAGDACFNALIKALLGAGWEVWYGGRGALEIPASPEFHLDPIHMGHAHARFLGA